MVKTFLDLEEALSDLSENGLIQFHLKDFESVKL